MLESVNWNKKQAAAVLEISRGTLYRKIVEYGLEEAPPASRNRTTKGEKPLILEHGAARHSPKDLARHFRNRCVETAHGVNPVLSHSCLEAVPDKVRN